MKYRLQDLIDMELFQSLQDRLNKIYSFPSAIIDNEGTILTATAWQDICTKFHRQNKVCEKECIKSDQYISDHLAEANPAVSYRCPHGLVDNATPIIIDGKHLANFFTGQFFLEKPDLEFFRKQAMKYGFDEEAYLAAVRKVPVWTQEQLNSYLFFIKDLIEVMANIGLKNLRAIETGKKIQESEERFHLAMRGANDGLWDWNLSTDDVYYSPRWMSMLGYAPNELEHGLDTWKRLVHPDDQEQALTAVRSLLEGQSDKYEVEFRMQHKDGSFRHILSRAFFADDVAGNHKRLVGTHVDITERKWAEKAIKESEANLNSLINCRDESIWSIDRNYNYIFFNTFFRDAYLAAYNRELKRGMNAIEILTPSMQALWKPKYDSALAGQKAVFEFSVQTGNDLKFYEVYLNPILLEGKITGASALSLDITARKKIDDARMFLVECGSKGEDFFRSLARYLARSLDMDYVCIDSLEGDLLTARTVAIYSNGGFEDNVSYTLHDTPCGEVVGKDVCCFPEGVRQRFLKDAVLQDMKAESYIGVTLWSYDHRPIGLIAVIGQRPLADPEFAESILKLAAIRAAGELERRKADEALSHSHDLMRYIIEHNRSAIAVHDRDLKYIYVSQRYLDDYKVKEKDVIGKHHYEVFPDLPQKWRDVHQKALAGEVSSAEDDPYIREDGSMDWTRWECRPWYQSDGTIGGIIVYTEVITERKQAEEKIRQSEQFIRNILDTVDEGFIVIDRDYRILTANKAYCSQAGGTCETIIGRHCYETSHRTTRPCFEEGEDCASRRAFETAEPHTAIHKHKDPNGALLYVETKAFPIKDNNGLVTSVIEVVNNITEKYLLEEERLKTQKLEAIGTLAGGIAHDFNNLLQGVFGYISMAKMTLDQKERSLSMLEHAEQALHMSVNLTTQLLTFSKGGKPVKNKITLRPVIENSARFGLSGSNVDYRIDLQDGLWAVEADEGQISQVIQNIVINADQAMPEGGAIEITAQNITAPDKDHPQLPKGKYVEIAIKDSGIGISEQYLKKIFDPYFTTKEKGSGLGLATSYSIIKNHGGLIDVASEPNKGTTFFLYLPAAKAEKETKELPVGSSAALKGKVLVMDDDDMILNIAGEMIKVLGHEVDFARHGEAAVEKYRSARQGGKPFDIVILDLTIRGGMGGAETIERLRALDPGVKAIVSSGYSEDAVVADHEKYGFKARLNKPYRLSGLRDTLNALLSA